MKRSGLTLIEVLVTMTVMLILSLLVIQIAVSSSNVRRHSDVHETAYRNTMLGLEHVARYLRGARAQLTEDDGLVTELVVDLPTLDEQRLVVSQAGDPTYDQTITLRQNGAYLVAIDETAAERRLADLGTGSVGFQMVGPKLLQVTLASELVGEQDKQAGYTSQRRFYLANQ